MVVEMNPVKNLMAWRGATINGRTPYPFFWFVCPMPDRPSNYKTREVFVGKTMTITVWSDEVLSRHECLTIATMEATGKCQTLHLNE